MGICKLCVKSAASVQKRRSLHTVGVDAVNFLLGLLEQVVHRRACHFALLPGALRNEGLEEDKGASQECEGLGGLALHNTTAVSAIVASLGCAG